MNLNVFRGWGRRKRRRSLDAIDFASVIGEGSIYRGALEGAGDYLVQGSVEGECALDGTLVLGAHGRWVGNITATMVVIAGEVEGHVTAHIKLELKDGARIRGDIASPVIAIAAGAAYEGEIRLRRRSRVVRYDEKRDGTES